MRSVFSTVILFILFNFGFAQEKNPYVREGSVGKRVTPESETPRDAFTFRPISKWIGERFIFLPKPKSVQEYGYQSFDGTPSYRRYVGRIAKVVSVEENRSLPKVYFKMEDTGEELSATVYTQSISGIGPLADIDSARARWLNTTLWYKGKELVFYNEQTERFGSVKIKRYSPVKIVDIVAGWYEHAPIRFIVQSPSGDEGYVDINLSGTNVSDILRKYSKFEDDFFTEDPRKTFKWSEKIWSAIEDGKVFIGMTAQQAEMSWGKPKEINRTIVGSTNKEQWVYASGSYLYFDNGILSAIQN